MRVNSGESWACRSGGNHSSDWRGGQREIRPNSLLAGKIPGISSIWGLVAQIDPEKQW
jgi:hypothetical protein